MLQRIQAIRAACAGAAVLLGLVASYSSLGAAGQCYDIQKGEPAELTGLLEWAIFPGPPEYADVQMGDSPEPQYILQLDTPICIDLIGGGQSNTFDEVQVVSTEETASLMRILTNSRVTVSLSDHMEAHTAHHRRPLVAWVKEIRPSDSDNAIAEYGTAATTVRAFYLALGHGAGDVAAEFVIPEKRSIGPLSAKELTGFYRHLIEPLKLLQVSPATEGAYEVLYQYTSASKNCVGRSRVKTVRRDGKNYVASIEPLDGC